MDHLLFLPPWALAALVWNIITFCLFGYDKLASKTGNVKLRLSERSLLAMSFCFGAIGTTLAMRIFRHKTQHKNFCIFLPLCALVQVAIYGYLLLK